MVCNVCAIARARVSARDGLGLVLGLGLRWYVMFVLLLGLGLVLGMG